MPQPTDTADHLEPVDTGFVAFCYAERIETPLNLLGQAVIDLIMSGVDRSNIQKPFRTREMAGVSLLPIAVYAPPLLPAGLVASMAPLPLTVMAGWLLSPFVNSVWTRYQTPGENTANLPAARLTPVKDVMFGLSKNTAIGCLKRPTNSSYDRPTEVFGPSLRRSTEPSKQTTGVSCSSVAIAAGGRRSVAVPYPAVSSWSACADAGRSPS